jgi:hypothetical protein
MILLLEALECWDYRPAPPLLASQFKLFSAVYLGLRNCYQLGVVLPTALIIFLDLLYGARSLVNETLSYLGCDFNFRVNSKWKGISVNHPAPLDTVLFL